MTTERWTDSLLDGLRSRADPAVDEIVQRYQEHERPEEDPRDLIGQLARHGADCPHADFIADYHGAEISLPAWADSELLRGGQDFFERWSLQLASSLFYASLPNAYGVRHGAKVLVATGQLTDSADLTRRIAETGQFLIDIFTPETGSDGRRRTALEPGTSGYRAVRTVRLFHSAVRYWIARRPPADNEGVGTPISQEDLLGTLCSFTVAAFDAFDRMRVPYSDEGAEAYLHTWCVVGCLLGIEPDLLPLDRNEATHLAHRIAERHQGPSDEGRELTEALLEDGQGRLWPIVDRLPRTLLHHLAGSEVAAMHRVPPPPLWMLWGANMMSWLNPVVLRVGPNASINSWFGRRMLKYYIDRERGDRPPWSFVDELDRKRGPAGRAVRRVSDWRDRTGGPVRPGRGR